MADGDFGGWLFGGDTGGATTSIVGGNYIPDFGGSVGASGFFEPTAFATDFGAFSNFTNDFNNYVATQAPTLFMAYDTTIPPSPVLNELRDQIPAILAQQDQIKTLATSLNNVTGKLQQDYTNYSNVYNQNIKPYNDTMATYNQYIRYRDQTQPGSYLWNRHNSNANQKLNEANTYVKTINDAASKYETDYKTYQTEVKALEDSVNTYKDTFNTFKDKADTVPKTTPTPEPTPEPPTVPSTTDTTTGTTGTTGTTDTTTGTDTTGTGTTGTVTTSGDVGTTGTTGTATTDTTGTTGTVDTTGTGTTGTTGTSTTDQEIIDLITNPPITTPDTTPVTTPVIDTTTPVIDTTTPTQPITEPTVDPIIVNPPPDVPPVVPPTVPPVTPPDIPVEPITVNPPPDVPPVEEPKKDEPKKELPVVPPVVEPVTEPTKTTKDPFDVPVKFSLLPPETATQNRRLSTGLGIDTNVGSLLGAGLATRPDVSTTSEPYLLGSDDKKKKNVWNIESLRGALGI